MSQIPETNPFASPLEVARPDRGADADVERIRKEHLSREASIKSIAILNGIAAILLGFAFVSEVVELTNPVGSRTLLTSVAMAGLTLVLALIEAWLAVGMHRLWNKARIPGIIVSALYILYWLGSGVFIGVAVTAVSEFGLIAAIPILINAYIIWLLATRKGKYVMSSEYREVIDATPHIKYKTSIIVWILLIPVLFLLVLGLIGSFFG